MPIPSIKRQGIYYCNSVSPHYIFHPFQESQKGIGVDLESDVGDRAIFNIYKGLVTSDGKNLVFFYTIVINIYTSVRSMQIS